MCSVILDDISLNVIDPLSLYKIHHVSTFRDPACYEHFTALVVIQV